MNYRQLILAAIACLIIYLFFHIPIYHKWADNRLVSFSSNFREDLDHLDLTERKLKRLGTSYELSLFIKERMKLMHADSNGILLVPPSEVVNKYAGTPFPEPLVFYFYTGIRSVSPQNKIEDVYRANYALLLKAGSMGIKRITGIDTLQQVLQLYKSY